MNKELTLALIQTHLAWENPVENRAMLSRKIKSIEVPSDLIILPEMFTTGFSMNARSLAETMHGETIKWLLELAKEKSTAICGSLIIKEKEHFYNRFVFITPEGETTHYDKHQLFTMAEEREVYTPGNEIVIIDYKGWKIKPQICYDLRFPVWARNTTGYDLLLYVASWPKTRINAWDTLLRARAIENMSYCIGVNRIGLDGNGYEYNGHSGAYNVLGHKLNDYIPIKKDEIQVITLLKSHIENTRKKLPFLEDADTFKLL
ncbi:nitrilase family protein [Aquimarina sp. ERC-38]|uniref:nitrilase family protein n=1 Tax=Aquimarina sp. ERC-38 TaxID=2949996 RepID=UPI002246BE0B|nr:nitrilase family protein [Aquimarina sp. ERC-38]UZO82144.1 nitrilase family protein [Aquimarina sp. ERC-38]